MSVIRPTFSIVIAVCDQAMEISKNLPSLLTQRYDGDYEVIVVDESSVDDTADILKQLKNEYTNLYSTFLPKYHFQRNRQRLALTLGVKASKKEWIIFYDIHTPAPSDTWLSELSDFTVYPTVLLLGYINKKKGDVRLQKYEQADQAYRLIKKTEHWRNGIGHFRWMRHLLSKTKYKFIVVPTASGHETLRMFE